MSRIIFFGGTPKLGVAEGHPSELICEELNSPNIIELNNSIIFINREASQGSDSGLGTDAGGKRSLELLVLAGGEDADTNRRRRRPQLFSVDAI